jgi:predicted DNA-binding protein with PD1-like motif
VLGRRDGSAVAGHLLEAHVWPTLEVVLVAYSDNLNRQKDPETGLALLVP